MDPSKMCRFLSFTVFLGTAVVGCLTNCISFPPVQPQDVTYTLYTSTSSTGTVIAQGYVSTRRTIYIVHSWMQTSQQGWISDMKTKYLNVGTADVIIVDWSKFSMCINYYPTAEAVQGVGETVGTFIAASDNLGDIQINGYGLGAHVAGIAGQRVQTLKNGSKIARINGLDASNLFFGGKPVDNRLDATDAQFVQAFHTSYVGISERYGTVDVYFVSVYDTVCVLAQTNCPSNPGVSSPAPPLLPNLFCDSIRSVVYFIESIVSKNFRAVQCTNCHEYALNTCTTTSYVVGEHMSSTTPDGRYYLKTEGSAPWYIE